MTPTQEQERIEALNWILLAGNTPTLGAIAIVYDPRLIMPYVVASYLPFKEGDTVGYFSTGSYIGYNVTHYCLLTPPTSIKNYD